MGKPERFEEHVCHNLGLLLPGPLVWTDRDRPSRVQGNFEEEGIPAPTRRHSATVKHPPISFLISAVLCSCIIHDSITTPGFVKETLSLPITTIARLCYPYLCYPLNPPFPSLPPLAFSRGLFPNSPSSSLIINTAMDRLFV